MFDLDITALEEELAEYEEETTDPTELEIRMWEASHAARLKAIQRATDPTLIDHLADVESFEWVRAAAQNENTSFSTLLRLAKESPNRALDDIVVASWRYSKIQRWRLLRAVAKRRAQIDAARTMTTEQLNQMIAKLLR